MLNEPVGDVVTLSWVIAVTGFLTGIVRSLLFHGRITLPHREGNRYHLDLGFVGYVIIGCVASALAILQLEPTSLGEVIAVGLVGGLGANAILEVFLGKKANDLLDDSLQRRKWGVGR